MVWLGDRDGRRRLAAAGVTLLGEVDARWPDRDRASDGTIGDPAHAARRSGHNPDQFGLVRAVDIDDDDETAAEEGIGRVIAEHIIRETLAGREDRCRFLIYHARIASSWDKIVGGRRVPAWTWRPYSGANAHKRHLHVELVRDWRADDPRPWGLTEEDTMTPEELRRIIREEVAHIVDDVWRRPITARNGQVVTAGEMLRRADDALTAGGIRDAIAAELDARTPR